MSTNLVGPSARAYAVEAGAQGLSVSVFLAIVFSLSGTEEATVAS